MQIDDADVLRALFPDGTPEEYRAKPRPGVRSQRDLLRSFYALMPELELLIEANRNTRSQKSRTENAERRCYEQGSISQRRADQETARLNTAIALQSAALARVLGEID